MAGVQARLATRHRALSLAGEAEDTATPPREAPRRYAPDIVWGATSLLLALVVGASIALYLK